MPWVRLHGVKDYLDMAEILKSYPRIKQTFNMVPSLLEQIMDYAAGHAFDSSLNLSRKKAATLDEKDKAQIIDKFFQANYDNMISPYPRYKALFDNRKKSSEWKEAEWRDLVCLFNLAWIDPSYKNSGRLRDLSEKGSGYTEEDREAILESQTQIISRIVPGLREMMESGQIEISTTPYFHPIMPIVQDSDVARVAMPEVKLPGKRFNHPEDVDRQVAMAVELYSSLFGSNPAGMWPSEGSVSEEIVSSVAKYGIKWMATDEAILKKSLALSRGTPGKSSAEDGSEVYSCYRHGGEAGEILFFFRDHRLSDSIGFIYSSWDAEKAAADFMSKLRKIDEQVAGSKAKDPVVSVILDGENAWEFFKNDGHDFLEALYTEISKADWLQTSTFSNYLDKGPEIRELKRLFPGSWIDSNFKIWIGHEEDNRAWDLLSRARDELVEFEGAHPDFDKERMRTAWREIYIAEGSDWFWWFGDEHVGPNNDDFDRLYRSHLANVYYMTDREPPAECFTPIRSAYTMRFLTEPIDYISPVIDGKISHYYEWHQAGFFDCLKAGSTMQKASNIVSGIWFGLDPKNMYLRIDPDKTIDPAALAAYDFELEFLIPENKSFLIASRIEGFSEQIKIKYGEIIEVAIPLAFIYEKDSPKIVFRILVREGERTVEIWPRGEGLQLHMPVPGSNKIPWVI